MSHIDPVYNQTIEYFKGDTKGREKSTMVLDHAIKLKKIKTMKKNEIIQSKHVDHIENEKNILE